MSDDPRDALAKDIFGEDESGPTRQMRQYAYEERVIKRVFAESGVTPRGGWGYFVNQSREMIGVPKLSFQWFNQVFSFPGVLCGSHIGCIGRVKDKTTNQTRKFYAYEMTLTDLIKPAQQNKLIKAISKQLYKLDIDNRQKFVFCFRIVRTWFCAHNLRSQASDSWDKPAWRFQISTYADGNWLFVEPLAGLCQGIPAAEWFNV